MCCDLNSDPGIARLSRGTDSQVLPTLMDFPVSLDVTQTDHVAMERHSRACLGGFFLRCMTGAVTLATTNRELGVRHGPQ